MKTFGIAVVLSVLASCAATEGTHETHPDQLVNLDDTESQLRAAFNANSESDQLLLILSPT